MGAAARLAQERLQHREADAQDREVRLEDGVVYGLHRRAVVIARVIRVHYGFEAKEGDEDRATRGAGVGQSANRYSVCCAPVWILTTETGEEEKRKGGEEEEDDNDDDDDDDGKHLQSPQHKHDRKPDLRVPAHLQSPDGPEREEEYQQIARGVEHACLEVRHPVPGADVLGESADRELPDDVDDGPHDDDVDEDDTNQAEGGPPHEIPERPPTRSRASERERSDRSFAFGVGVVGM